MTACGGPSRKAERPAPKTPAARVEPAPSATGLSPMDPTDANVSYCKRFADQTAAREMQREMDVMEGQFRGGDSRVFQDFARMDAERYSRKLYESCMRSAASRKKPGK
jgi:hypothetical protein